MNLSEHADHKWSQRGRCVYCDDCQTRLYQGRLPARGRQKEEALGIDQILDAARKDILEKHQKEWDERTTTQNEAWEQGRQAYVRGKSTLDRMKLNPYKGTSLASWFSRGWNHEESLKEGLE